ncbi:predicted protein [Sclerotinia sclerotiorum 1980 UF-70]|uniref:GATA-type domain-containing protein n=1 Tax=Sclerotinia sclerotiorum (strain ATCC 18683 / 1980 / Ss-1) TaxID=665079 RepID=A7EEN5_SCLS1|nr:predicted protein [Sclerotinia sclerotiorum 1980 UF-70]EDO01301.1 predicted protein [Sclerotinia sclerotiorum 1980 UF-70]
MSFGWSAGDIAQAISVIFKTVKALDDAEGAPADFRNTVTFFQSVNLTLQRLQSLISIGKNSSYGDQIRKEVEIIKPSLERFLAISQTFESSLGDKATPGRWKHIPKKLLWRFKDSKAVRNLKSEIKDHLPVLDKWMLLSMIEIIQDLPAELQKHFTGVLNDQMVSILQLQLNPIHDELRMARTEGREHYKSFFSEFEQSILKLSSLQLDIASQSHTTQRNFDKVMSKLENKTSYDDAVKVINEHTTNTLKDMFRNSQALPHASFQQAGTIRTGEGIPIVKSSPTVSSQLFDQEVGNIELLRKVLRLANLMEPSRALNPVLLPKYHITFRDALGRRPRILQYDTFMNFKVLSMRLHFYSNLLSGQLEDAGWSEGHIYSKIVQLKPYYRPIHGRGRYSLVAASLCQMEVRESDINDVDERSNAVQEQSSINTSEAIESDIIHFSRLVYLTGPNRCHSCNGPETSEWKTQPDGARTLCNACESNSTRLNRYEMMEITEMLRGLPSRSRGSALGCRGGL